MPKRCASVYRWGGHWCVELTTVEGDESMDAAYRFDAWADALRWAVRMVGA
jgi:hypothetical protein